MADAVILAYAIRPFLFELRAECHELLNGRYGHKWSKCLPVPKVSVRKAAKLSSYYAGKRRLI